MRGNALKPRRLRTLTADEQHSCDWCRSRGHGEQEASFAEVGNWVSTKDGRYPLTYCAECIEGVDTGYNVVR